MLEVVVVHQDRHLLVLDKPTGLPTTGPDGSDCLVERAKRLDPEAERLHPSSRLDAEVTGLVTFARTREGTEALLRAREMGAYSRRYLALASSAPVPGRGHWSFAIGLDPNNGRQRQALAKDDSRGKPAETVYATLASVALASLLDLRPLTGRTHQLRVHAAHAGLPLLGDKRYGGPMRQVLDDGRVLTARRVMLHCVQLSLPQVDGNGTLDLHAPAPKDMWTLWQSLGGDPAALAAVALSEH